MKTLSPIIMAGLLAGCAFNNPSVRTETHETNGTVTIRITKAPTWAVWPATSMLAKQKLSNGKTQAIGTTELELQSGGTNIVEALKAIDSILGKIRP